METKYAAGQWRISEDRLAEEDGGGIAIEEAATGDLICELLGTTEDGNLIAAAPDLLSALTTVAERWDKYDTEDAPETWKEICSALAKARGEGNKKGPRGEPLDPSAT